MTNKDKCLLSYLAGIFDGEGCISILKRVRKNGSTQYFLRVSVRMVDWIIPCLFKYVFGGNIIFIPKRISKHRDMIDWYCGDNKAYDFLKKIKPFIVAKSEELKIAMSFQVQKRKNGYEIHKLQKEIGKKAFLPLSSQSRDKYDKYYQLLRNKHLDIDKGMNSVKLLSRLELRQYRAKQQDVKSLVESVTTMVRRLNNKKPISQ